MAQAHPDLSLPSAAPRLPLARGPVARFAAASVAAVALALSASFALAGPDPASLGLAALGHGLGAVLAVALMRRGYPHDGPGLCNLVTLARLALTAALLAPLVAPASGWAVLGVALVALALDGVDGWLARREGRASDFGARFDMEVDAALGLILALNAWASGAAGAAVLLLGLPRYAFVAAGRVLPWMTRPLPDRFGRKLACVMQIAALIALQVPGLPPGAAAFILALGAAMLGWSFGRDVRWLWRART